MMIEKYINEFKKECYKGVVDGSLFDDLSFHEPAYQFETDKSVALHTNLGSLTVLDRLTGYSGGIRDTETGYRDPDGKFWLASGGYDVRGSGAETVRDAINWVKKKANTCVGT